MAECAAKNMIDKDEYPQTAELERRCVNILSNLWNAPRRERRDRLLHHRVERGLHARRDGAAVALAGPAAGGRARRGPAEPGDGLERAGVLGEVLPLLAGRAALRADGAGTAAPGRRRGRGPVRREHHRRGRHHGLDHGRQLRAGAGDQPGAGPAAGRARVTTCRCTSTGRRAASSPRSCSPDLEWDFRVPRVASINASGHKYGLVYPGVGWISGGARTTLPDDLVFRVNYLGGEMPTFALNFSRPGAQVAAQYYNFLRLGREGYRHVQQTCQDIAPPPVRRDRQDGPVRAAHRGQRPAGVRVQAARRRHRLLGVRLVRAAADARLAGARVHLPGRPDRTPR